VGQYSTRDEGRSRKLREKKDSDRTGAFRNPSDGQAGEGERAGKKKGSQTSPKRGKNDQTTGLEHALSISEMETPA